MSVRHRASVGRVAAVPCDMLLIPHPSASAMLEARLAERLSQETETP